MTEYTPIELSIRIAYIRSRLGEVGMSPSSAGAEFDRWLQTITTPKEEDEKVVEKMPLRGLDAIAYEMRTANILKALEAGYFLGYDNEDEAWDAEVGPRLPSNPS